jgi:hypothetical protein
MLPGIRVLAVENRTISARSPEEEGVEEKAGSAAEGRRRSARNQLRVTLMVDPKQAQALQLANENGSVSLALRNPKDETPVAEEATVLSGGRLAEIGRALDPSVTAEPGRARPEIPGVTQPDPERQKTALEEGAAEPKTEKRAPEWVVDVLRGVKFEPRTFPKPADK